MKAILRSAVLAAGVVSTVAMMGAPAQAQGAVAFTGTATIDCFGCGTSTGTATLSGSGVLNGAAVSGSASASFDLEEPAATCPASGSASGSVTGVVNVDFTWLRVGATAVITTSGDIDGAGTAAFAVTSGLVCGEDDVTATFAGAVAGD